MAAAQEQDNANTAATVYAQQAMRHAATAIMIARARAVTYASADNACLLAAMSAQMVGHNATDLQDKPVVTGTVTAAQSGAATMIVYTVAQAGIA